MKNVVISRHIDLVWFIKEANNYRFTKDGRCFNLKSGREIKRTLVGYTEGFCLNGKFQSLSKIRKQLVKIEDTYLSVLKQTSL